MGKWELDNWKWEMGTMALWIAIRSWVAQCAASFILFSVRLVSCVQFATYVSMSRK